MVSGVNNGYRIGMNWWKLYLVLLALISVMWPVRIAYLGLLTLGLVYFIGGRVLMAVVERISLERVTDQTRLFPGDTTGIALKLTNPTPLPIAWLSVREHLPVEIQGGAVRQWVLSLPAKATGQVQYVVTGRRRGIYQLGPVTVTAGDYFGLHQVQRSFALFHQLIVYPRVYPLQELGLNPTSPIGPLPPPQRIYPDPSRFAGVRGYQPGDPRRAIHWKATARTGQLQVKQFDHTITADTLLALNLDAREYSVDSWLTDSELAIETAASLAYYLGQRDQPYTFLLNSSLPGSPQDWLRIPWGKGQSHLMETLEVLARARCAPAGDFPQLVAHQARSSPRGATLLLVSPRDSAALVATALSLVESGYVVKIFVTGGVSHRQWLHRPSGSPLQILQVRGQQLRQSGVI